jgi:hypothetical protein
MSVRTLLVSSIVVVVVLAGLAGADNPNQAFNGRIMVSAKRFPTQAKSPSAYTAAIRKQSAINFFEDKSDHTWKLYFAAFLKQPLNDVEYALKIYELSGNSQQLLVSADQYTDERGQRTIIANIKLDKQQVGVNKAIMLTVESKGKVLASSAAIKILGEGERFTGKVNFSEDEAQGRDQDDDAKKK